MKYLPVKRESEDYFDDTCLNNNKLLYEEKITDLIMNITDGEMCIRDRPYTECK